MCRVRSVLLISRSFKSFCPADAVFVPLCRHLRSRSYNCLYSQHDLSNRTFGYIGQASALGSRFHSDTTLFDVIISFIKPDSYCIVASQSDTPAFATPMRWLSVTQAPQYTKSRKALASAFSPQAISMASWIVA